VFRAGRNAIHQVYNRHRHSARGRCWVNAEPDASVLPIGGADPACRANQQGPAVGCGPCPKFYRFDPPGDQRGPRLSNTECPHGGIIPYDKRQYKAQIRLYFLSDSPFTGHHTDRAAPHA
jgi:hypothetical protein